MDERDLVRDPHRDYPSNSSKARAERVLRPGDTIPDTPTEKPQVRGNGKRMEGKGSGVFKPDVKGTASFLFRNRVIPAVKDALNRSGMGVLNMLLFGDRDVRGSGSKDSVYTNYSRVYYEDARKNREREELDRATRVGHRFDNIEFHYESEAIDILEYLVELTDGGNAWATVADFYGASNIEIEHTDYNWGWRTLASAKVKRLGPETFIIQLPNPIQVPGRK